ncbi:MAG: DUF1614 domain-containing protein [bacterium]|nr:DUF1614 domain-containing protein [bacterium]
MSYSFELLGFSRGAGIAIFVVCMIGGLIDLPIKPTDLYNVSSLKSILFNEQHHLPDSFLLINVGGAIIPSLIALYFLSVSGGFWTGLVMIATCAITCERFAYDKDGEGVTLPIYIPIGLGVLLAYIFAIDGTLIQTAYYVAVLGSFIGGDIIYQSKADGFEASSIGGYGTADGIFCAGSYTALLAGALQWLW